MTIPCKNDFEKYNDVALLQKVEDANGTIFGKLKTQERQSDPRSYMTNANPVEESVFAFRMDSQKKLNQNIALLGGDGTKAAEDFIKVQCFQAAKRRESVVLNDPGGRLHDDLAQFFEEEGYEVRCLNLLHPEESDGWNVLASLCGPGLETNVQSFVEMMMKATGSEKETIYAQGCKSLLKALILKVLLSNDFLEEERNLRTVYRLLNNPGREAFLDSLFIVDAMPREELPCLGPYESYKNCNQSGLCGEIITDLSTRLSFLQDDRISNILSKDGISLELPGKKKCAYFISYPEEHDVYKPILSVFFSLLLTKLFEYASKHGHDGKLYVPVNFFLPSIHRIGRIESLDGLIPSSSRKAINLIFSVQTLSQLKQTYPKLWQTLLANCSTRIFFGSNDPETRAYIQGVNGKALSCNDLSKMNERYFLLFDDHDPVCVEQILIEGV